MLNLYLFLVIFLVSAADFNLEVSALKKEGINGAYKSPPLTFGYQVGIIGRENGSLYEHLVCDGGIISPNLVISAGICFITELGFLRNLSYSVYSDYTNIDITTGFDILIDLIYLPNEVPFSNLSFAVTKLVEAFNFTYYNFLKVLDIPNGNEEFWDQEGQVAGHGFFMYRLYYNSRADGFDEFNAFTDYSLRNATVLVTRNSDCILSFEDIDHTWQFCGLMYSVKPDETPGICKLDTGSPLVIGNKAVGVAGIPTMGCSESTQYANVSAYWHFVNAIIKGKPLSSSIIYKNREHFLF